MCKRTVVSFYKKLKLFSRSQQRLWRVVHLMHASYNEVLIFVFIWELNFWHIHNLNKFLKKCICIYYQYIWKVLDLMLLDLMQINRF